MVSDVIFYSFAAAIGVLAIAVVAMRKVFHGGIALAGCLSVVAALFALMGADFLAAAQLLVYVGGIVIILLFVIMLAQRPAEDHAQSMNGQWVWALLLAGLVSARLVLSLRESFGDLTLPRMDQPTTAALARLLMGDMLVPFEVISVILLAALVGAVLLNIDESKS